MTDSCTVLDSYTGRGGLWNGVPGLLVDLLRGHGHLGVPGAGLDQGHGSALLLCVASAVDAGLLSHVSVGL